MLKGELLVVDDEPRDLNLIISKAREGGFEQDKIWGARSFSAALEMWKEHKESISVIVLDIKLEGDKDAGWNLLKLFRRDSSDITVLIYSATFRDIEKQLLAVTATTIGLYKKNGQEDELWKKLAILAEQYKTQSQKIHLSSEEAKTIDAVSNSDIPVLIVGESGSGKTVIAREIALRSGCDKDRIIPINCANLSKELAGSVLFGSMKGIYTDALTRAGKMMIASGFSTEHLGSNPDLPIAESPKGFIGYKSKKPRWGAVILDEIGSLHPAVQAELLLILEGEPIQPLGWVGKTAGFLPNFRVIAATNEKDKLIDREKSNFRGDLLRRLTSWVIECKPLADEPNEKIENIIKQTIISIRRDGKLVENINPSLTPEAVNWLVNQKIKIPGGYRELQWLVQRAWVIANKEHKRVNQEGEITLQNVREAWDYSAEIHSQFGDGRKELSLQTEIPLPTKEEVNNLRTAIASLLALEPNNLNWESFRQAISATQDKQTLRNKIDTLFIDGHPKAVAKSRYTLWGMAVKLPANEAEREGSLGYATKASVNYSNQFRGTVSKKKKSHKV